MVRSPCLRTGGAKCGGLAVEEGDFEIRDLRVLMPSFVVLVTSV